MTARTATTDGRWFLGPRAGGLSAARLTLFCLPYAGSGASAFRRWATALGPEVEVLGVQLPGRESRLRETARVEPAEVAAAIAGRVARPYAVYGHSLGARLGYEVVRELQAAGAPLPTRLVVGGCAAPDLPNHGELAGVSRLPDEQLLERLVRLGGIPPEVVAAPELLDLLMPAIRADFTWIDDYEWQPAGPLPVPVTAICGRADRVALPPAGVSWSRHSAPGFAVHSLPGGHFFLHDELPALAARLRSILLGEPVSDPPDRAEIRLVLHRGGDRAARDTTAARAAGAATVRRADTDTLTLVATGDGPLGLAVEPLGPVDRPDGLHRAERAEQDGLPAEQQPAYAVACRTARAALGQVAGPAWADPAVVGFAGGLHPDEWQPTTVPEGREAARWRVSPLRLPGALGALATPADVPGLSLTEAVSR